VIAAPSRDLRSRGKKENRRATSDYFARYDANKFPSRQ
jgi:hypothetical protein